MKQTITICTGNKHKFMEMKKLIPNAKQRALNLLEIQAKTGEEVIRSKLKAAKTSGYDPLVVEDTSLYLDALGGFPGPLIKWFMESAGVEAIAKICTVFSNTKATAETVIGLLYNGKEHIFVGRTEGTITERINKTSYGWDPIFIPNEQPRSANKTSLRQSTTSSKAPQQPRTYAEMSTEEKNEVSHRGKAVKQLLTFLEEQEEL